MPFQLVSTSLFADVVPALQIGQIELIWPKKLERH